MKLRRGQELIAIAVCMFSAGGLLAVTGASVPYLPFVVLLLVLGVGFMIQAYRRMVA